VPKNNRSQSNNNPEGYNQYNSGWTGTARERPFATAAAAAAAVGASVFLWSRRNQISNQISSLSDQIGEWNENRTSGGGSETFETASAESSFGGSLNTGSAGQFSGSGLSEAPASGMSGGSGMGSTPGSKGPSSF
jgi:hypothetical protein